VVEQAVRTVAGWTGPAADLSVSVNVCPASLLSPGWAAAAEQVLLSSGLAPGRLTVEITEGTVIAEPDRVRQVLAGLRRRGVQVALDDFGTGWSSLAYLERYPVDELKVDRLFVSRLADATSAPVVDAVLSLGRALGLRTVAEGVETWQQRDRLLAAGCDAYQGYLVSRPLPEAELLQLVAARSLPAQRAAGEERQARPGTTPR
jgi:EAL domain-containing protein (putative c-di-GMP-specific phosphodiesterase class I)